MTFESQERQNVSLYNETEPPSLLLKCCSPLWKLNLPSPSCRFPDGFPSRSSSKHFPKSALFSSSADTAAHVPYMYLLRQQGGHGDLQKLLLQGHKGQEACVEEPKKVQHPGKTEQNWNMGILKERKKKKWKKNLSQIPLTQNF